MKLLIVEDDSDIIMALYRALTPSYIVDSTTTVAGALNKLANNQYDVVILDLSLPDAPGLVICERIREQGMNMPILVISESADVLNKVKLLDSGANDYMTKPFDIEELKARLRVLLRQPAPSAGDRHRLVVADLILDSVKHHVERCGKDIVLRKKEFAVLECLMKNTGRVVSRSALIDYAWEYHDYGDTNTVDVHIKYLRDKVDRPYSSELIKTIHGLGYMIDASRSSKTL